MKAIETTGRVKEDGSLEIDQPIRLESGRVKVIIMYKESTEKQEEEDWKQFVSGNPAFDFLKEPEEDIYTPEDGTPIANEK